MTEIEKKTKIENGASASNSQVDVKKKKKGGKFFKLLFLLVLAGFIYSQYELYKIKQPNYQQKVAEEKNREVIESAKKIMVLPEGNPQVLYVQDVDALKKQQPFFSNAQNGDAVLLYPTTAIIYSIAKDKIINVGPVINENEGMSERQVPQAPQPAPKAEKATTTGKQQ
jgi:hypothetical protein